MDCHNLTKIFVLVFLLILEARSKDLSSLSREAAKDCSSEHYQVIVVGAGVSGLAAASTLVKKGIDNVLVVEAMDRVGGRVYSLDLDDVDDTIEMGAQFIHGERGNIVYQIASRMDIVNAESVNPAISMYSYPNGTIRTPNNIKVYLDDLNQAIDNLDEYETSDPNESLGTFFDEELDKLTSGKPTKFVSNVKLLEDVLHRFHLIEESADNWYDVNLIDWIEYITWEGEVEVTFKKGHNYREYLNAFLPYLKNKIKLNSPITRIVSKKNNDGVEVHLKNAACPLEADYVIVTVPLGVLKKGATKMFVPALPQGKLDAIDLQGFSVVNKIYLWYPEPWWLPVNKFIFFINKRPMNYTEQDAVNNWTDSISYLYKVENRPNLMSLWLAGEGARVMESLSDEQLAADIKTFMDARFGDTYPLRTEPTKILRSRWGSNPYVRGSYSYGSIESIKRDLSWETIAEPFGRVHFAGEATSRYRHSSVDGATEAGLREAKLVRKRILRGN